MGNQRQPSKPISVNTAGHVTREVSAGCGRGQHPAAGGGRRNGIWGKVMDKGWDTTAKETDICDMA